MDLLSKLNNRDPHLKIIDATWISGKSPDDCRRIHDSERIPVSRIF